MPRRSPRAVLLWLGAVLVAVATAVFVATDLAALHGARHARRHPHRGRRPSAISRSGTTIGDDDVRRGRAPLAAAAPAPWPRLTARGPGRRGARRARARSCSTATSRRAAAPGSTGPSHAGCAPCGSSCATRLHPPRAARSTCSSPSTTARARRAVPRPRRGRTRGSLVLGTDDAPAAIEARGHAGAVPVSGSRCS